MFESGAKFCEKPVMNRARINKNSQGSLGVPKEGSND